MLFLFVKQLAFIVARSLKTAQEGVVTDAQSFFRAFPPTLPGVPPLLRRKFFVTTCALFVTSFIQPKMQKPGLFMQTGFSSFMQLFGSLERQTASSVSPFSPGVLSSVWA